MKLFWTGMSKVTKFFVQVSDSRFWVIRPHRINLSQPCSQWQKYEWEKGGKRHSGRGESRSILWVLFLLKTWTIYRVDSIIKQKSIRRRFITCIDMHGYSIIKHLILFQKYYQMFANLIIKHFKGLKFQLWNIQIPRKFNYKTANSSKTQNLNIQLARNIEIVLLLNFRGIRMFYNWNFEPLKCFIIKLANIW